MEQGSWESFGGRVRFGFVDFGIFPVVLVWPQMNRVSYLLLALGICTAPPPLPKEGLFWQDFARQSARSHKVVLYSLIIEI